MSQVLQAALNGEYAAIYAYGRAGGRLRTDQERALALLGEHRADRDLLRSWIVADGDQPEPPAPAYQVPDPLRTDGQARALLADVELRLIPLSLQVLAEEPEARRRAWAVRSVRRAALAAQSWGAAGQAFPWPAGIPAPA